MSTGPKSFFLTQAVHDYLLAHAPPLDDGPVHPKRVEARRLGRDRWDFEVTIAEGRKREVRRLCAALGLGVERLVRIKFGPVELGTLASGATRKLSPRERSQLAAIGR